MSTTLYKYSTVPDTNCTSRGFDDIYYAILYYLSSNIILYIMIHTHIIYRKINISYRCVKCSTMCYFDFRTQKTCYTSLNVASCLLFEECVSSFNNTFLQSIQIFSCSYFSYSSMESGDFV